jgi:hypothetical protein
MTPFVPAMPEGDLPELRKPRQKKRVLDPEAVATTRGEVLRSQPVGTSESVAGPSSKLPKKSSLIESTPKGIVMINCGFLVVDFYNLQNFLGDVQLRQQPKRLLGKSAEIPSAKSVPGKKTPSKRAVGPKKAATGSNKRDPDFSSDEEEDVPAKRKRTAPLTGQSKSRDANYRLRSRGAVNYAERNADEEMDNEPENDEDDESKDGNESGNDSDWDYAMELGDDDVCEDDAASGKK